VRETAGLLFVYKPAGLTFHSSPDEVGLMPHVRELYPDQPLFPCHRLDRMTSGLLMVAKSHEAAAAMAELLRERRIVKYYVALSAKKPKKKMGRVMGDMARSRRGQWMLCRTMSNPAITHFISEPLCDDYRAFVLKPATGQTHQLRVALKSLGSPVLGDPRYAASGAALEDRGYLHAAALRLPPGWPALTDGGRACNVVCPPLEGSRFGDNAFQSWWAKTFPPETERGLETSSDDDFGSIPSVFSAAERGQRCLQRSIWFAGSPVESGFQDLHPHDSGGSQHMNADL